MRRSGTGGWEPADEDRDEDRVADWDWRLSIADVDTAGAFSSFPGMTRILTVIEGASVTLTVDGAVELLEKHRPFKFDGGAETSAVLPHGPIRDLNLISRTGVVDATVSVEPLTFGSVRPVFDGQYCVILDGNALLTLTAAGSTTFELKRFDTVLGSAQHPATLTGEGTIAVITVSASVTME